MPKLVTSGALGLRHSIQQDVCIAFAAYQREVLESDVDRSNEELVDNNEEFIADERGETREAANSEQTDRMKDCCELTKFNPEQKQLLEDMLQSLGSGEDDETQVQKMKRPGATPQGEAARTPRGRAEEYCPAARQLQREDNRGAEGLQAAARGQVREDPAARKLQQGPLPAHWVPTYFTGKGRIDYFVVVDHDKNNKRKRELINVWKQLPTPPKEEEGDEEAANHDLARILRAAEAVLRDAYALYSDTSPERKMTQQRANILNEFYAGASGRSDGFRYYKNPSTLAKYFATFKQLLV
ncbi:hypothetical protein V502_02629, partial [Pseudogymnoascus sp. VKM F-4520 (FW-2644)]